MPVFNDRMYILEFLNITDTHAMCPFRGGECVRTQCIAARSNIIGTSCYFLGCDLIDAVCYPKDYTEKLEEIRQAVVDKTTEIKDKIDNVVYQLSSDTTSIVDNVSWDTTILNSRMLADTTAIVDTLTNHRDETLQQLNDMEAMQIDKFNNLITKFAYANHLSDHNHRQHNHPFSHYASDDNENLGSRFVPIVQPALYLLQEWISGIDTDNNGRVYGKDFMIPNNDPGKPMMLKGIEKSPDWRNPRGVGSRMTYAEYVSYVKWTGEV